MKKTFELPALYGDHHVLEVRRLLLDMPGVHQVTASSAFQMVEVIYDEHQVNDLELAMTLDEAGYLGEWSVPLEQSQAPAFADRAFTRHTEVYAASRQTVSFAQKVIDQGRPLWTCPGMGVIRRQEMED